MIDAYSLVHDDLPAMDNDLERRGLPTVHVKSARPTRSSSATPSSPLPSASSPAAPPASLASGVLVEIPANVRDMSARGDLSR